MNLLYYTQLNPEAQTMAFPKDTAVKVTGVTNDGIIIEVGPNGYTLDKGELSTLMSGQLDDIETLKRNIATSLLLAGVNIEDDIAIKAVIEGRTYKLFR